MIKSQRAGKFVCRDFLFVVPKAVDVSNSYLKDIEFSEDFPFKSF
jgi:hypothetical protein